MNKNLLFKIMAVSLVLLTACNFTLNTATTTPAPAIATSTTSGFAWPDESGECTLHTDAQATVYSRPSNQADVFGQVDAGFETAISSRTTDGWAGFDPGVAQAANMGIFHQRWIFFDDATFSGGCASLPFETWTPDPVACYTMPMEVAQAYSNADSSSSVLATLNVGNFAAVTGLTNDGWAQVDLGLGNTGVTGIGWMDQATLNFNGSACSNLPAVTP